MRALCSSLANFVLGAFLIPLPSSQDQKTTSHREVVLDMALSQGVSKDSGYWDYALLMFYDEAVHTIVLSGLTSLTNFGWAERTALIAAGALDVGNVPSLLNYVRGLSLLFVGFSRNLTLLVVMVGLFALPSYLGALEALAEAARAQE